MFYISIRCQIAVHQECYGARHVRDFTSWVCKACETPEVKRECCLCPVKGKFLTRVCLLSYVFVICMKIYFTILISCSDVIFFRPTGGALKPTDIETLWVHITCAWFRPEVSFASDEKMEPALGILSIPSNSFVKVDYLFLYIIFYDTSHYIC